MQTFPIDELISQMNTVLPDANIQGVKQIMKQRMDMIKQFNKFALLLPLS